MSDVEERELKDYLPRKAVLLDGINMGLETGDVDQAFKLAAIWEAFYRYDDEDELKIPINDLPAPSELRGMVAFIERIKKTNPTVREQDEEYSYTFMLARLADDIESLAVKSLGKKEADAIMKVVKVLERDGVASEDMAHRMIELINARTR